MSPRQPDEPEPYHRQWLHAAEGDATIDSDVMLVLRIYADVAHEGDHRTASMSRSMFRLLTHLSYDRLQAVHEYAEEHGWLARVPGPPKADKRSVYYALMIGRPGERRRYRGTRPKREGQPTGRSVQRIDLNLSSGSVSIRATDQSEQSVPRIDSIRGTDQPGADQSVARNLTLDSQIDRSSLRPGTIPQLLAQVGEVSPDVIGAVSAILQGRSHKPAAVLYTVITEGRWAELRAEAQHWIASRRSPSDQRPSSTPAGALCPRCVNGTHAEANCPTREPQPDPEPPVRLVASAAADERCRYERCLTPGAAVPEGSEYHDACGYAARVKGRRRDEMLVDSGDGGHAA